MPLIFGVGAAASLAGGALSGYFGSKANKEQASASRYATRKQLQAAREAREFAASQAGSANALLGQYSDQSAEALQGGYKQGLSALEAGNQQAASAIGQYGRQAGRDLSAGYRMANQTLAAGLADATGQLRSGYGAAQSSLSPLMQLQSYGNVAGDFANGGGRLNSLLGGDLSRENAFAGFEADPGYQFRQKQGEQSIQRAAAAQGGRLGGRTLAALADYNQNLASQEYGNFANRRAGLNALQMQGSQSADASQLGAAMNLANVGYGAQSQSADMDRMLGSQLAGLTTSNAAAIAGNNAAYGLGLSGISGAQGTSLANLYATGGQQAANMHVGSGTGLANIYGTTASNMAGNLTGVANTNTQLTNATLPAYSAGVPYAGGSTAAWGNAAGQALGNISNLGMMYGMGTFGQGGGATGGYMSNGVPSYGRTMGYGGMTY